MARLGGRKFSHEMSPCNVCMMRTHRTDDCPGVEGGEGETGGTEETEGSSDDSDEDIVAMMMRATCQDVKTRHGPTTGEGRVGKPSKRTGQRARVIFLRDDADIGGIGSTLTMR